MAYKLQRSARKFIHDIQRGAHNNVFRSLPANETIENVFTYFSINLKLRRFNGMLVLVNLYLAYGQRQILS